MCSAVPNPTILELVHIYVYISERESARARASKRNGNRNNYREKNVCMCACFFFHIEGSLLHATSDPSFKVTGALLYALLRWKLYGKYNIYDVMCVSHNVFNV